MAQEGNRKSGGRRHRASGCTRSSHWPKQAGISWPNTWKPISTLHGPLGSRAGQPDGTKSRQMAVPAQFVDRFAPSRATVKTPGTTAGRSQVQKNEAEQDRRLAAIQQRDHPLGGMSDEIGESHLAGQDKGHRTRE
ncbi:hypothetical protein D9M68_468910 [compost metagenome]